MGNLFSNNTFSNSKNDFDQSLLPINRKQQFKKIFLTRFTKLLQINILCFVFFLPLLCWDLLTNIYKSSLTSVGQLFQFVLYTKSPIVIILTLLSFLGLAGSIYYIRRLSWGEPVHLFKTFLTGIKQSYKQFLGFGLITGIFISIFDLAISMMNNSDLSNTYVLIFISILSISCFLYLSIISYSLTLSSLYEMKFLTIIKTSALFTIKNVLKNLLFVLLTYGLVLSFILIGMIYLYFIGIILLGIIGISYIILVWILYTNSSYDIYINLKQYPSIHRKGLRTLTKEGGISA